MRGVDEVFSLAVHTAISLEEGYNSRSSTSGPGKSGGGSSSTGPSGTSGGGGRGGKKIKKRSCKIL